MVGARDTLGVQVDRLLKVLLRRVMVIKYCLELLFLHLADVIRLRLCCVLWRGDSDHLLIGRRPYIGQLERW